MGKTTGSAGFCSFARSNSYRLIANLMYRERTMAKLVQKYEAEEGCYIYTHTHQKKYLSDDVVTCVVVNNCRL